VAIKTFAIKTVLIKIVAIKNCVAIKTKWFFFVRE
jgi:hypothetical protein